MINVHMSLIDLAGTLPIRAKGGEEYALGVTNLFEMHPPSMYVDLVASLRTLGSGGTTWMQTDPHPLILKPVSVSEILACLISIRLNIFSFPRKPCLPWYLK